MKYIITFLATIITGLLSAQEIYLEELDMNMDHSYSYQVAIKDYKTDKTLFIQEQNEDLKIEGYGEDFIIVYRKSMNKIYVKDKFGKVISGFTIPTNTYIEAVDYAGMSDHERFNVKIMKIAFKTVNTTTGEILQYNKFAKCIGGRKQAN